MTVGSRVCSLSVPSELVLPALGDEVSTHYDPMIAKLVVRGENRRTALKQLWRSLAQYQVSLKCGFFLIMEGIT